MKTSPYALLCLFILSCCSFSYSQVSLSPAYAVNHSDSNLFYGAPTSYRGCPDSLYMDLYKPVNGAQDRPIVILVHGGGFYGGGRKAPTIVRLADSIASRGYMVASIDYRLGFFNPPGLTASFGCVFFQLITGLTLDACTYPADSAEVYRAAYRGMQDLKGAIRYLKGRAAMDSTDKNHVFIGGESAGGIVSLTAAMLDQPSEKPLAAGLLPDAIPPNSSPTTAICNLNLCDTTLYARPDLGSIDGDLWLNGENTDVVGVLSFAGGVLEPAWMDQNTAHPRIFLYHQPCDPIVPFDREKIYKDVGSCIVCAGCPGFSPMPYISGGGATSDYNALLPSSDQFAITNDFTPPSTPVNCYFGLWGPAPNTCPQPWSTCSHCNNSIYHNCHDLLLTQTRMDDISTFLFTTAVGVNAQFLELSVNIYPNPTTQSIHLQIPDCGGLGAAYTIYDAGGRTSIGTTSFSGCETIVDLDGLGSGLYFVHIIQENGRQAVRKIEVVN